MRQQVLAPFFLIDSFRKLTEIQIWSEIDKISTSSIITNFTDEAIRMEQVGVVTDNLYRDTTEKILVSIRLEQFCHQKLFQMGK